MERGRGDKNNMITSHSHANNTVINIMIIPCVMKKTGKNSYICRVAILV